MKNKNVSLLSCHDKQNEKSVPKFGHLLTKIHKRKRIKKKIKSPLKLK